MPFEFGLYCTLEVDEDNDVLGRTKPALWKNNIYSLVIFFLLLEWRRDLHGKSEIALEIFEL